MAANMRMTSNAPALKDPLIRDPKDIRDGMNVSIVQVSPNGTHHPVVEGVVRGTVWSSVCSDNRHCKCNPHRVDSVTVEPYSGSRRKTIDVRITPKVLIRKLETAPQGDVEPRPFELTGDAQGDLLRFINDYFTVRESSRNMKLYLTSPEMYVPMLARRYRVPNKLVDAALRVIARRRQE